MILPPGKQWIEGKASDPGVRELFAQTYGQEVATWLKAIVYTCDHLQDIAVVYRAAVAGKTGTDLDDVHTLLFGADAGRLELKLASPLMPVMSITASTHQELIDSRRRRLGPYKQVAAAPGAGGLAILAPALEKLPEQLASAMATKKDRMEKAKLSAGDVVAQAVFIAGDWDSSNGKITSLALPKFTTAYTDARDETTKEEKTKHVLRLLNTGNQQRPAGSTHAIHRCMPVHDPNLASAIIGGNFALSQIDDITQKAKRVGIHCFIPLLEKMIDALNEEGTNASFRDSIGNDVSNDRDWIACSPENVGYDQVKGMFANFASCGQVIFVVTRPGEIPFAIIVAEKWLEFLIDSKTKTYFDKRPSIKQKQFLFNALQCFDHFLVLLAKAADDHRTNKAVRLGNVDDVQVDAYEEATKLAIEDLDDTKKKVTRTRPFDVPITCLPITKTPAKKPRFEQQAAVTRTPSSALRPSRSSTPVNSIDDGFGLDTASSAWSNNRTHDVSESKRKGDLICMRNFNKPLHPELMKKYCADYSTVGKACPGCNKLHRSFHQWEAADRTTQITHVDNNRNSMFFNAKTVKSYNLPTQKRHLLGTKDGRAGER